jgi:hypothetical protein
MVPVRTHWGKRGKSRIDSVPGRQSGTATPPTAQQHIPPPPPLFPCQLIRLWTRKKGATAAASAPVSSPRTRGPVRTCTRQRQASRAGGLRAHTSPSARAALYTGKPSWAHTRQASCVLTGARESAQRVRRPRRRVIRLGSRPTRATYMPAQPQTRVLRG